MAANVKCKANGIETVGEPHLRISLLLVLSSTRDNLLMFVPTYTVLFGIYEFNTLRPTDWQYFVFQHLTTRVGTNAIEYCSIYIEKLPNKKSSILM